MSRREAPSDLQGLPIGSFGLPVQVLRLVVLALTGRLETLYLKDLGFQEVCLVRPGDANDGRSNLRQDLVVAAFIKGDKGLDVFRTG
ncbi:MAG: hypothetical protein NZ742_03335 [Acidobacteria bacterium]|nr:hypothetical protein [Acidobacteriota bacterium]MDW7983156.1 hypothetical protein [Acidobacteriota bacterium]